MSLLHEDFTEVQMVTEVNPSLKRIPRVTAAGAR